MIVTENKNKLISYVGYTSNIKKRLLKHNSSKGAKFTRGRKWMLLYLQKYKTKKKAMKEEYILKKNYYFRNKIKLKYLNNEKKYIYNFTI